MAKPDPSKIYVGLIAPAAGKPSERVALNIEHIASVRATSNVNVVHVMMTTGDSYLIAARFDDLFPGAEAAPQPA